MKIVIDFIKRIVTKFVSPNLAGLPVMLIVSENCGGIRFCDDPKSMILKHLRQIVTCGILGGRTTVLAQLISFDI